MFGHGEKKVLLPTVKCMCLAVVFFFSLQLSSPLEVAFPRGTCKKLTVATSTAPRSSNKGGHTREICHRKSQKLDSPLLVEQSGIAGVRRGLVIAEKKRLVPRCFFGHLHAVP